MTSTTDAAQHRRLDTLVRSTQACQQAGCSYRMLDYWVKTGVITPTIPAHGTGSQRLWSPLDVDALRALATIGSYSQSSAHLKAAMGTVATLIQQGAPGDWAIVNRHGHATIHPAAAIPDTVNEALCIRFRHSHPTPPPPPKHTQASQEPPGPGRA
ncbi:MAG: MerR family transcriptional regulator, partial [Actinomycetota bacterium]|nr:MerR family transcriptional regulator [Actinomycetota bacterium]